MLLGGIFRSSRDPPFRPSSLGDARHGCPVPAPHLGPHPAYAAAGSARPVGGNGRSGSWIYLPDRRGDRRRGMPEHGRKEGACVGGWG